MKVTLTVLLGALWLSCASPGQKDSQANALRSNSEDLQSIVVWLDEQYLPDGDSFLKQTAAFHGQTRSEVRTEVIAALKQQSTISFERISPALESLEASGQIRNLKQHWIVNGFSCETTPAGRKRLEQLEGVSAVFEKQAPSATGGSNMGPEFLSEIPENRFRLEAVESYPWNIEKIRAPEVWKDFGVTGEGVLNVVHDSGFKLDVAPLAETIYVNTGEIPGNGLDDDKNGYIDDYHGYHFDAGNANLNEPFIRRGTNIHGNLCAAMIVGTFETDSRQAIGIAPKAQWAPLIAMTNIEQAVEWAIMQGADTYSMSFSQPNIGEYRTHWRKVLEHGTLCGIVFISGAGNFAAGPNAAPVPVQMRNPEDIPNAVLGVAGVGEDGQRPKFSSQGPVEWNTSHYQDGEVNKPDFATINFQVPCIDPEGRLSNMASGNSLAGPHMAGIVALMLSANPELLPWEVKEILISTAQDIGEPGFDYQSGHGFVNAYDAVKKVLE